MRTVSQLLEDKMDEAVAHYINTHQTQEGVHVDSGPLSLNIHEDSGRQVVTVMHPQSFHHSSLARSISIGEVTEVPETWNEELIDADGKLAAIVAHLAQNNRPSHTLLKVATLRSDLDSTVLTDGSIRLFNSHALDDTQPIQMTTSGPTLPPLTRCQSSHTQWLNEKTKSPSLMPENDTSVLEAVSPTATKLQSKKSLPHKKRISRRLKRSNPTGSMQQPSERDDQDLVVIDCAESAPQEEILPDNFAPASNLPDHGHQIAHEVRPIFICQICGDFYGEEQLKFYQHLKQHYEPHATIIIENPVPDLGIDKMSNTCIVDNVSQLPDSLVELSLENTLPSSKPQLYQTIKEHILYTTSEKTLTYNGNKILYSMASSHKEPAHDHQKESILYEELNKSFDCNKCNISFRKQKYYEAHMKEAHSKLEIEIAEFSEPEDLMEGIHVTVTEEGGADPREGGVVYEDALLPHLGVDNGGPRHEHVRHWYMRDGVELQCGGEGYCPVCVHPAHPAHPAHPSHPSREHPSPSQLKEEVFQRIFEVNHSEPTSYSSPYDQQVSSSPHTQIQDNEQILPVDSEIGTPGKAPITKRNVIKREPKEKHVYKCEGCDRVFKHRNSLRYHITSHGDLRPHVCCECGKAFLTTAALKVHKRIHTGDRPFTCSVCGKKFRQYSDVKYHMSSIHSTEKQFKCEFCDKEFARKYSLNVHRTIHTGERKYQCDYCPKTFRASCYRNTHMRAHTGEKPYKCEICARAFKVKADLKRHMIIHSECKVKVKMEITTEDTSKTGKPNEKPPPTKKDPKKKTKPNILKTEPKKIKRLKVIKYEEEINEQSELNNKKSELEASKLLLKSKIVNSNEYYSIRTSAKVNKEIVRAKKTDTERNSVVKDKNGSEINLINKSPVSKEVRQSGESGENVFIEQLTALYNIPPELS